MTEPELEIIRQLVEKVAALEKEVSRLSSFESIGIILKDTAGDPATGYTGQILINTSDNKIKMYAESGWREMATW